MVESEKITGMPPEDKTMAKASKETIHSGHFMVSEIDDNEVVEEVQSPSVVHESDCDQESTTNDYQYPEPEKEAKTEVYTFGPRSSQSLSIEVSLTQLFQCMSLAYSAKLTSPRWKTFKGLKLRLKDKIRLNNIIWRAWHIQFISKRKPPVCQFVSPLDADSSKQEETMVVDNYAWKSKSFNSDFKKRHLICPEKYGAKQRKPNQDSTVMAMDLDSRWSSYWPSNNVVSPTYGVDDDLLTDFSDTLFSTLLPNQPFDLPNPREIAARAGNADFMQPGLTQLQPSLDDFMMDTFDHMTEFLQSRLPPLIEESEQAFPDPLAFLSSQQNNNAGSIAEQKSYNLGTLPQTVTPCETSYPLVTQTFPVEQQNTSTNLIANSMECSNMNLNPPQEAVQNANTLSLNDMVKEQSAVQNSVTSIVNSSVVPAAFNLETALPSLQTSQRSSQASLPPYEPLLIVDSSKNQNTIQARSDISSKVNELSQNCEQSYSSRQLVCTQTASQVPLVSRTAIQEIDGHSNRTASIQQIPLANNKINAATVNFPTPVHIASSVPSQLPITTQSHISLNTVKLSTRTAVKSELPLCKISGIGNGILPSSVESKTVESNEQSQIRRHSYTGVVACDASNRRTVTGRTRSSLTSITNVPSTHNIEGKFAVPQLPIKQQRVRSRSMSSPQNGIKANSLQSSSSASLTNTSTSSSLASRLSSSTDTISINAKNSFVPNSVTQTVLPQNAMLAQLLTGNTLAHRVERQSSFPGVASTTTVVTTCLSSTVTIIANSLPTLASTTQTFVLSPVAIATVASPPTLSRNLFVETTNQAGSQPIVQDRVPNITPSLMTSSNDANSLFPNKPFRPKSDEERVQYKEHRRVCHINAEQKRRCNIKNGFEALRHLLPSLSQNPNAKISKAAMLQKGAEYIRTLKMERQQQQEEAEMLRQQRDSLNESISMYQNQLPATGAPIACQRTNRIREMFDDYVRTQTLRNWKFWVFSLMVEPLLEAFNNTVSTNSVEELCKSVLDWVEEHCSLQILRRGALDSLRRLCTTTNILTDPSSLPEEATSAVTKKEFGAH